MKPLVLTPQHFGALVFERATSRYVPFDAAAAQLLARLQHAGIDELAHGLPPAEAETARGFFDAFEPRGYFTPDGRFGGEVREVSVPRDHLVGPLAVHLEVLGACNLTCTHCFAAPLPRNRDALKLAEMDSLFAELDALGSFRLGLTGGEPLMRKDLLDVVDAALAHGLHPCLTTNGLLLDEPWARELSRHDLVWLNVSLDGATAATNDAVRGAGTFDAVTARLRALRGRLRFTLAFTLMRHNVHEVQAAARLARELGAHTVVFRPLYPAGAARHRPELLPGFDDYSSALASLSDLGEVRGIDPFSPQMRLQTNAEIQGNHGCGAGNTIATVSVRGDVNPCSFLGPGFDAANLRERTFTSIWNESEGFRAMRALSRDRVTGRFAGGCRARALQAHGDHDAPDPWQAKWEAREGALPPGFTLPVLGHVVD